MRVGIDLSFVQGPSGSARGGLELVRSLAALEQPDLEIYAYVSPAAREVLLADPRTRGLNQRQVSAGGRLWSRLRTLGKAAAADELDVFHATAFFAPLGCGAPQVVTVHDLRFLDHPLHTVRSSSMTSTVNLAIAFARATATAQRVVASSAFSASRIAAWAPWLDDRLAAVPLGVRPRDPSAGVRTFDPDSSPLLVAVGELSWLKNQEGAIEAFAHLCARPSVAGCRLALVGPDHGGLWERRLIRRCRELGVAERVSYIGSISDGALAEMYERAAVLVHLSRIEGFGLPVLEAMAAGVPVIAAETSAIPEITGRRAILVPPDDPHAAADAMEQLLTDGTLWESLSCQGVQWCSRFSWERTAMAMLDIYRCVAEGRLSRARPIS